MFYVDWDKDINGVLLTDKETSIKPPRPVFFEELDLLGFNEYWDYPKSDKPLLWSSGRKYYYNGDHVATANKGDALNLPDLIFPDGYDDLKLKEIDIDKVISRNEDELFIVENESLDFISSIRNEYSSYPLSVSFSGGKDSQAVLDLVTRIIPDDELIVIFTDTTLENQFTLNTVDETIELYKEKCPRLMFEIAKPSKSAFELFNDFGLPSRIQRWCANVLKIAPFNNVINDLIESRQKIIVFEGVRNDESVKRSKYKQVADSVVNPSVINVRPILSWNFTEVVLYNYYRGLPMNKLYRYGHNRVGCELCPNSSLWSDCIYNHMNKDYSNKYIPFIKTYAHNNGLFTPEKIDECITKGHWKQRHGNKAVVCNSSINFIKLANDLIALVNTSNDSNFVEWLKILGKVNNSDIDSNPNVITGDINVDGNVVPFEFTANRNKRIIDFFGIQNDTSTSTKIKKVLKKYAICVQCGACEAECSKGALKTAPNIKVDSDLCNHCLKCINVNSQGCYRCKSIAPVSQDWTL